MHLNIDLSSDTIKKVAVLNVAYSDVVVSVNIFIVLIAAYQNQKKRINLSRGLAFYSR